MNLAKLEDFKRDITQIREYMKHIQYSNDVANYTVRGNDNEEIKNLLLSFQTHYKHFKNEKKIFEYKAIVISLYGILEKYIEIWIKDYLEQLSLLITDYRLLNKEIREEHFRASLKLITLITDHDFTKYENLKKEDILANLHNAIQNHTQYIFNTDAFVIGSGNLKHTKIVELLKRINIDLNMCLNKHKALKQYIQSEIDSNNIDNFPSAQRYKTINDLVAMRNTIAHGADIDTILDNTTLKPYIDFIEQYGQAIFETIEQTLLQQEVSHNYQEITIKHKVWGKQTLGCAIAHYTIQKGDWLIVKNTDDFFYKTRILELQIDNISNDQFIITSQTDIGIRVEPPIYATYYFYLMKKQ